MTWNRWGGTSNWSTAGAQDSTTDYFDTHLATFVCDTTFANPWAGSPKSFDFNNDGIDWLNAVRAGSQDNNGFILRGYEEYNHIWGFWSTDSTDSSYHPNLKLDF